MEQDGHLKSLAERMREKAEQERIETEKVFSEQLQTLKSNLLTLSQNAVCTMSDAMAQEIACAAEKLGQHYRVLSIAYGKAWMRTAITATAILFGLIVGGWGLMKGADYWLETYRLELAQVKTELQDQRQTLEKLKSEAWGLTLHEDENGRFIIIPVGTKINPTWTRGKNQAIRLE